MIEVLYSIFILKQKGNMLILNFHKIFTIFCRHICQKKSIVLWMNLKRKRLFINRLMLLKMALC